MQRGELLSSGSQHAQHTLSSGGSGNEGDGVDVTATSASVAFETSAASSTTIASSSLSTFSQTTTAEKVEHNTEDEEGTASYFVLSHTVSAGGPTPAAPPQWVLPLRSQAQEPLPVRGSVQLAAVSDPLKEPPGAVQDSPFIQEKTLPAVEATELRARLSGDIPQRDEFAAFQLPPGGEEVEADMGKAANRDEGEQQQSSQGGSPLSHKAKKDETCDAQVSKSTCSRSESSTVNGSHTDRTIPPLTTATEVSPMQSSPASYSNRDQQPPLSPTQSGGTASLAASATAIAATVAGSDGEKSVRNIQLSDESNPEGRGGGNRSDSKQLASPWHPPNGHFTSHASTTDHVDDVNSEKDFCRRHETDTAKSTVEKQSTADREVKDEYDTDDYNESYDDTNKDYTHGRGETDAETITATTQEKLRKTGGRTQRTPAIPAGASMSSARRRHLGNRHDTAARCRPLQSGLHMPATARLSAGGETARGKGGGHTNSNHTGAQDATASPHHRPRLQLSAEAPPLIAVDAPVTMHTLEVASTRSSLLLSSASSEVSMLADIGGSKGEGKAIERESRDQPTAGDVAVATTQVSLPLPCSRKPTHHNSWSAPLFSSCESSNDAGEGEHAAVVAVTGAAVEDAAQQHPPPASTAVAEEKIVGETVIVPVSRISPTPAAAPLTNTQESPHVPHKMTQDSASAPPQTSESLSAPLSSPPPSTCPTSSPIPVAACASSLVPLFAAEEEVVAAAATFSSADNTDANRGETKHASVPDATTIPLAALSISAAPDYTSQLPPLHPQTSIPTSTSFSPFPSAERQYDTALPVLFAVESGGEDVPRRDSSPPTNSSIADAANRQLQSATSSSSAFVEFTDADVRSELPVKLTAGDTVTPSPSTSGLPFLRTATTTQLTEQHNGQKSKAAADGGCTDGFSSAGLRLPPQLSITNSVATASLKTQNSWTLKSPGLPGLRLSMSGFPTNSLGGQSPLTMALFANRGTVSVDDSCNGDRRYSHGHPAAAGTFATLSSYGSHSYSYSYSGSYTYESTSSNTGSPPRTSQPGAAQTLVASSAAGVRGSVRDSCRGSTSLMSTQHQQELSVTRVGPTDGAAGTHNSGGCSDFVTLTAYEEVAAVTADTAVKKGEGKSTMPTRRGKFSFLRCLCRRPPEEQQRMWRTEEHASADTFPHPTATQPSRYTATESSIIVSSNESDKTGTTPPQQLTAAGSDMQHTGSTVDLVETTASASVKNDCGGKEEPRSSPEVGTTTEAGRDRDSHRQISEAGNGAYRDNIAMNERQESEGSDELRGADTVFPAQHEGGDEEDAADAASRVPESALSSASSTCTAEEGNSTELATAVEQTLSSSPPQQHPLAADDVDNVKAVAGCENTPAPSHRAKEQAVSSLNGGPSHGDNVVPSDSAEPNYQRQQAEEEGEQRLQVLLLYPEQETTSEGERGEREERLSPQPSALTPLSTSSADLSEDASKSFFAAGRYDTAFINTAKENTDAENIVVGKVVDDANRTEQVDVNEGEENRVALTNSVHDRERSDALHRSPEAPGSAPTSPLSLLPSLRAEEEVPPLEPLRAFYVYDEELPRYYAWDAEPPVARVEGGDKDQKERNEKEKFKVRLQAEAAAATTAAQVALHRALSDMAVYPPRQCLFVEVHGLEQLCRTVLCPRQAKVCAAPAFHGFSNGNGPAAAATAITTTDVWRGDDWKTAVNNRAVAPINGIVNAHDMIEMMEDPEWVEVRLAVYSNDRQHLVATGSVFKLPVNTAAMRRSCTLHNTDTSQGVGHFGLDSWSDVLVYQLAEQQQLQELRQHSNEGNDGCTITSAPLPASKDRCKSGAASVCEHEVADTPLLLTGSAAKLSSRGDSVNKASSVFNTAALYVQLEERKERWVGVDEGELEEGKKEVKRDEGREEGLALQTSQSRSGTGDSDELKTDSEEGGSVAATVSASSSPSEKSPAGWHTRRVLCNEKHDNSLFPFQNAEGGLEAAHEAQRDAMNEKQQGQQLRREEYWNFLAVSSPLPMAELRQLATDGPSYAAQMTVSGSVLDAPGAVHEHVTLSCRVRWAVEPPPSLALFSAAPLEDKETKEPTWAAIGSAIYGYARTIRGRGDTIFFDTHAQGACTEGEQDGRQGASLAAPLTVLWNTIRPPAAALQCQAAKDTAVVTPAHLPEEQQQRWRISSRNTPALRTSGFAVQQRLSVCSVVMHCGAAVLLPTPSVTFGTGSGAAQVPPVFRQSKTYCASTVLSVTGGLDGFVGCTTAAAIDAENTTGNLACRTPVMRYNLDFHALLTREEASSLLLTVQSAAAPADVFGFAEFNPFEYAAPSTPYDTTYSGVNNTASVMELWLPLFAPAEAALTAAEAQERRLRLSTSRTQANGGAAAAVGTSVATNLDGCSHRSQRVADGGMVLTGWLHCDVEVVYFTSFSEAAAQRLWNGSSHSLTSLDTEAAAATITGSTTVADQKKPWMPFNNTCKCNDGQNELDCIVDFCVVEAAGLRPLATRFGATLPSAPLLWNGANMNNGDIVEDAATAISSQRCTNVYCEVLALQQDETSQGQHWEVQHRDINGSVSERGKSNVVGGSAARDSGVLISASQLRTSAADTFSLSHGSAGLLCASASIRGRDEGGQFTAAGTTGYGSARNIGASAPTTALPLTAVVTDTNHPRWQHTFRCGLASVSTLCLRVFDRAASSKSSESGAGSVPPLARSTSANRSLMLGTATVSPWMLRRLAASVTTGPPRYEGSLWLPLLWIQATSNSAGYRGGGDNAGRGGVGNGTGGNKKSSGQMLDTFSSAVMNGYVLVQWRRASAPHQAEAFSTPLQLPPLSGMGHGEAKRSSHSLSVTRRCVPQEPSPSSARQWRECRISVDPGTQTMREKADIPSFPIAWYDGMDHSPRRAQPLNWMSPGLAPWLWVHRLRLQWPWLQHVLATRGGHVRLNVVYWTANDEHRKADQLLLVPLNRVLRCGDGDISDIGRITTASRRKHIRWRKESQDDSGTFSAVSAASLSPYAWQRSAESVGAPTETTFCLPPSRRVDFQLWWYPNTTVFPAMDSVATASAACQPPHLLGGGCWHFPTSEADTGDFGSESTDDDTGEYNTGSNVSEEASRNGVVTREVSARPVLHRFFIPHEADVRLTSVSSATAPQHVADGVLRWQLSSVPRLVCTARGGVREQKKDRARTSAQTPPTPRLDRSLSAGTSGTSGESQRWQWPDVGIPAVLQVQVHNLLWFHRTDEAVVAAATGHMEIVVGEVAFPNECSGADGSESTCWIAPADTPNVEIPRLPYELSGQINTLNTAEFDGGGGARSDARSSAPSSRSPNDGLSSRRVASVDARAARERQSKMSATPNYNHNNDQNEISASSPAVELRWAPRRFEWLKDDVPTVALWVLLREDKNENTCGIEGKANAAKEGVWGAVQLPRLEALSSNTGLMWLPLFKTYALPSLSAPQWRDVKGDACHNDEGNIEKVAIEEENGEGNQRSITNKLSPHVESPPEGPLHAATHTRAAPQSFETNANRTDDVVVEHVGFAAVSYTHNFVHETPTTVAKESLTDKGAVALSVRTTRSRLLLLQAGPLRCRHVARSAFTKTREESGLAFDAHSNEGSVQVEENRCHTPHSQLVCECAEPRNSTAASVSYSFEDATALTSTSAAQPSLPAQSSSFSSMTSPVDDTFAAEVLLGFEDYQAAVLVQKAVIAPVVHDKSALSETAFSSFKESAADPIVVFPWRVAGGDRRAVRVQARLPDYTKAIVTVGNTLIVGFTGESEESNSNQGAQWVSLILRHGGPKSNRTSSGATEAVGDGDCVVGEVLVRWCVAVPPLTDYPNGADRCAPMEEQLRLHQLAKEYCGGAGAPCLYAVLHSSFAPAAAAPHLSVPNVDVVTRSTVVGIDRGLVKTANNNNGAASETAGRVRAWAASLSNGSALSSAALRAAALHRALDRIGPTQHPCMYLLLDHLCLECDDAQLRGLLQEGGTKQQQHEDCRFRLQVTMTWPAEWSAKWLRTVPSSAAAVAAASECADEGSNANSSVKGNEDMTSFTNKVYTVWIDVVEGLLVGAAAESSITADSAVAMTQRTLRCRCLPLCLPLPSPQHIQHALGLAGFAARFHMLFRLFTLRRHVATSVPKTQESIEVEKDPLKKAKDEENTIVVCVGAGRTPLSFPHFVHHGMTSLTSLQTHCSGKSEADKAGGLTTASPTQPLLLSWRARVAANVPLPFSDSPLKHAARAGAVAHERITDDQASLSLSESSLGTQNPDAKRNDGYSALMPQAIRSRCYGRSLLARLTVRRIEVFGVDVSLACGAAQRHRKALAPVTVAALVGDEGSEETNNKNGLVSPILDYAKRAAGTSAGTTVVLLAPFLTSSSCSFELPSSSLPQDTHVSRTLPQQQRQQRYSWRANVCVPTQSQLVLYVRVAEAALRAARGEEMWSTIDAEASIREAAGPSSSVREAVKGGYLFAKATYTVDAEAAKWVFSGQEQQQGNFRGQEANGHEVLLDLESLTKGQWLGRLWLSVAYLAVSASFCDPRDIFFSRNLSVNVTSCSGLVVGDAALSRRVEAAYQTLRARVRAAYEKHGCVPRRLRQHVAEVRQMRRQLRRQEGRGVDVRLVCASEGTSTNEHATTYVSQSFQLVSSLEVARAEVVQQSVKGTKESHELVMRETTVSTSGPLLSLSRPIDSQARKESGGAAVATSIELQLVPSENTNSADMGSGNEKHNNIILAVGLARLPLPTEFSLHSAPSYTRHLTVSLTPYRATDAAGTSAVTQQQHRRNVTVTSAVAGLPGSLALTAAWSVTAACGDTYFSCLSFDALKVRASTAAAGYRSWLLRWVYVFEWSAHPEVEHAVDMPLLLRPSLPSSYSSSLQDTSEAKSLGTSRLRVLHQHRRWDTGVLSYWSGATTRLPSVGAMGATIRRVELVEAMPLKSSAVGVAVQTTRTATTAAGAKIEEGEDENAYTTTLLATQQWSIKDDLQLRAKRRHTQRCGEDAFLWLHLRSNAAGGRDDHHYKVLIGVYSSNAVAQYETLRLEQQMREGVDAISSLTVDTTTGERQMQWGSAATFSRRLPIRPLSLCSQDDVNAAGTSQSTNDANTRKEHCSTGEFEHSIRKSSNSAAERQCGGVVMKTVHFCCGGAALTAAGLQKRADYVTCRVIRCRDSCCSAGNTNNKVDEAIREQQLEKAVVVLEVGQAVHVLQTGGASQKTDFSITATAAKTMTTPATATLLLSAAHITATWGYVDRVDLTAASRETQADDSSASRWFEQPRQNLLRLDIPTSAIANADAFSHFTAFADSLFNNNWEAAVVKEEQLCLEVCVSDGDTCVRYVSTPFSAHSVLDATKSAEHNTSENREVTVGTSWTTRLSMRLSDEPFTSTCADLKSAFFTSNAAGQRANVSAVADVEVLWGLDVLGIQPSLAIVPYVILDSDSKSKYDDIRNQRRRRKAKSNGVARSSGPGSSNSARVGEVESDDENEGEDLELQQLEGYAAWKDFFTTLQSQDELREQQAHLRHWRCHIAAVEVEGLTLPAWPAGGASQCSAGTGGLTTLLAQLSFASKRRAPTGIVETTKGISKDEAEQQDSGCSRSEDCVLRLARTTAVRVTPTPKSDNGSDDDHSAWMTEENAAAQRQCILPHEMGSFQSYAAKHTATYCASFTPLSWCIALRDIIRNEQVTQQQVNETKQSVAVEDRTTLPLPPPGLSLWQLLTPTAAATATTTAIAHRIGDATSVASAQVVYALGSVQLSQLLREGALILVQILERWCSGACTHEDRDALLRAASSFPTQWVSLTSTTTAAAVPERSAHAALGLKSACQQGSQTGGSQRPRVRFFYSFFYDGPECAASPAAGPIALLKLPALLPAVPVPNALADAVFCAQLDHVKLTYPSYLYDAATHYFSKNNDCNSEREVGGIFGVNETEEAAAMRWLSRLQLRMRVVLTTVDTTAAATTATDEQFVIATQVVARWATRLAPVPSRLWPEQRQQQLQRHASALLPQTKPTPVPVPVAVPVPALKTDSAVASPPPPTPVPVTPGPAAAASIASAPVGVLATCQSHELSETNTVDDSARQQLSQPVPSVRTATIPALPTTSCFYWQPPPTEHNVHTSDSAFVESADVAAAMRTAVRISVEVEVVLLPESAKADASVIELCTHGNVDVQVEDGTEGEEIVGSTHVNVGRTQPNARRWDRVEGRLDEGWRLTEPLSVSVPVERTPFVLSSSNALVNTATNSPAASSGCVSFDFLPFTAPSWGLVNALQAAQRASNKRRLHALASLQRTEARLLAAVAGFAGVTSSPIGFMPQRIISKSSPSAFTLQRLSAALVAHPYRMLRVPPAVYQLDSFAVVDVIEQTEEGCGAVGSDGSVSLWSIATTGSNTNAREPTTTPGTINNNSENNRSSRSVMNRKTWLVSAASGEVYTPQWRLLPTLTNTATTAFHGQHNTGISRQQKPLSWLTLPAGRLLLQERARLRLVWRRSSDDCPVSSLAGLVGGAAVSYTSDAGDGCLWVSGGLRLAADSSNRTVVNTQTYQRTRDSVANPARAKAPSPVAVPPPRAGSVLAKSTLHRRRFLVASGEALTSNTTPAADSSYRLYASHFLCQKAPAENSNGSVHSLLMKGARQQRQQWKVEVDVSDFPALAASASSTSPLSSTRLFHTATQLTDNRVWLLGGWSVSHRSGSATLLAAEDFCKVGLVASLLPVSSGLVERRRSEVRHAVTSATTTTTLVQETVPAQLQWCEAVSCVRCMADGTPAPPVDVVPGKLKQEWDSDNNSPCSDSVAAPRIACHVAAACGSRHVVLFGGLMPRSATGGEISPPLQLSLLSLPGDSATATADLHIYDTVQGVWTRLSGERGSGNGEHESGDGGRLWPMARYGHSCAAIPGTGGTQPGSYFVFGGATTALHHNRNSRHFIDVAETATRKRVCELVPPEELLWIWTPFVRNDGQVRCTWRQVQMPADLPSPLTARFLPQLLALTAVEVMASIATSSGDPAAVRVYLAEDEGGTATTAAADTGLASLVLCVAGGMTTVAKRRGAVNDGSRVASENITKSEESRGDGALIAFQQFVEPWLRSPAGNVSVVLLTSMCERPMLQ